MNKIKILKASTYYNNYLKFFYSNNKNIINKSYSEQYNLLMSDCFGWSDFWKTHLEETGKFEVFEVVSNAEYLQKAWAIENKIKFDEKNWLYVILENQIQIFKPDVLFAHDNSLLNSAFLNNIKQKFKHIKLIIGIDGVAEKNIEKYKYCDIMLSCLDDVCEFYNKNGLLSKYYKFGFETNILKKITQKKAPFDFTFIGSLQKSEGYHKKRYDYIINLIKKTPLKIWSSDIDKNWAIYKWPQRQLIKQRRFKELYEEYMLNIRYQGEAYGIEMYDILANSKITFNSHIDIAGNKAANMRLYEATGVGTCLLTDYKDNINDLFEPDKEIITYNNINEAIDKINFILKNDIERNKIAEAGQKRTLKNYNNGLQINEIGNYILKNI